MGVVPRPSDAKTRFITSAALLFQRRGYSAVGLTEIIEAAQAPKGSFYHHFPNGKEELAAHSLRWAGDYVAKHFERAFAEAPDFGAGVAAMARTVKGWLEQTNFEIGCPIVSISVDQVPQSKLLTETAQSVLADWVERIAAHAARHGLAEPRDLALRLIIAYQGGWVVARIQQNFAALDDVVRQFRDPPRENAVHDSGVGELH
ncbi:MAG: TetR/AcrR family transcriptional regulator [Beijerinckiaceae bacterium]|nr:TetR/AcrR family transcriptional regulator [Beijerinckiaceae bacterium]